MRRSPKLQRGAHREEAIVVRGLKSCPKGHANHKCRAKQLFDVHILSKALMRLHNSLPDVAITKLLPPLLSQVCLSLDDISTTFGGP